MLSLSLTGKILLIIGSLIAIAYLGIAVGLWLGQSRLIFVPSRQLESTPEAMGLAYEAVWIPVLGKNGKVEQLSGWWLPNTNSHQVLLYLHGNGSNISGNLGRASRYHRLGFSVLLLDYRGYGLSQGEFPNEARVYQDSQAAWHYLVHQRHCTPQQIFIYGHSLGGAIAIDLAIHQPEAAGVIVESSFTSIRAMVDNHPWYRIFPLDWLLHQQFDSLSKLPALKIPLLLIHGEQDQTIPVSMSQTLYQAATVPKQILLVPEADHNNVSALGDRRYDQAIEHFVRLVRQHQTHLLSLP